MRILVLLVLLCSALRAQQPFSRKIEQNLLYTEAINAAGKDLNRLFNISEFLLNQYPFPYRIPAITGYNLIATPSSDQALFYTSMAVYLAPLDEYSAKLNYIAALITGSDFQRNEAFYNYVFTSQLNQNETEVSKSLMAYLDFYKNQPDLLSKIETDLAAISALKTRFQGGIETANTAFKYAELNTDVSATQIESLNVELQNARKNGAIPNLAYSCLLSKLGDALWYHDLKSTAVRSTFERYLTEQNLNPFTGFLLVHSFGNTYSSQENQRLIEILDVLLSRRGDLFKPQITWLLNKKAKALRELNNYAAYTNVLNEITPLIKDLQNPDLLIDSYLVLTPPEIAKKTETGTNYLQKMQRLIDLNPHLSGGYQKVVTELMILAGLKTVEESVAIRPADYFNRAMLALQEMDYEGMIGSLVQAKNLLDAERKQADAAVLKETELVYTKVLTNLAGAYIKTGRPAEALETAELIKNAELNTLLNSNSTSSKTVREIQASLATDEAIIYYLSPGSLDDTGYFNFLVTKNNVEATFFDFTKIVADLFTENPSITSYVESKLAKKELRRPNNTERPAFSENYMAQPGDARIFFETYRTYLEAAKEDRPFLKAGEFARLSANIWYVLFPNLNFLRDIKKITIVPTGELSFIPFETLINPVTKRYLIEDFEIGYAPSASVLVSLRQKQKTSYKKNVLAFGDAKYSLRNNTHSKIASIADIKRLQLEVNEAIESGKDLDFAYGAFQTDEPMKYLIGTKNEVEAIKQIVPLTDVRLDKQMTENEIKSMSDAGLLKDYKVIHLASHASVNPYIFEMSAIAMSVLPSPVNGEDGMLTVNEIKALKMNPDLVMLSACQTGLGRITTGDAVQGLNNSLFQAGANASLTSLWSVNDYTTSIFVQEFYKKVFQSNIPYVTAATEIKRAFIAGAYGDEFKHPTYWAPFIYYGK